MVEKACEALSTSSLAALVSALTLTVGDSFSISSLRSSTSLLSTAALTVTEASDAFSSWSVMSSTLLIRPLRRADASVAPFWRPLRSESKTVVMVPIVAIDHLFAFANSAIISRGVCCRLRKEGMSISSSRFLAPHAVQTTVAILADCRHSSPNGMIESNASHSASSAASTVSSNSL